MTAPGGGGGAEDPKELARQLEHGGLYTHSVLSRHADRINRLEALVQGLVELGQDSGWVTPEQVATYSRRARERAQTNGEALHAGVVLRMDGPAPAADVLVDCEARLPLCRAACCRLAFPLSVAEVEGGRIRWELGQPYYARKEVTGMCVHRGPGGCAIYADRPGVCRGYTCATDERIWKDFARAIPNTEWMEQHLGPGRPRLYTIRMDRIPG